MIIFNGRHPGERTAQSLVVPASTESKRPILPPNTAETRPPFTLSSPVVARQLAPADAALRVCLAAHVAASEVLLSAIVPQIRSLALRFPQANLARLSRLVLEMELRGIAGAAEHLEGFLRFDGFAQTADSASSVGSWGARDPHFGDGANHHSDEAFRSPVDRSQLASAGQSDQQAATGMAPEFIMDALATPAVGRMSWQWFSLVPSPWSAGGSIRIGSSPHQRIVNLDITVPEGQWQFHWSEPRRSTLYFAKPDSDFSQKQLSRAANLLRELIGPLGFCQFTEIQDHDWYDGFNYLPVASILRRVDLFT